MSIDRASLRHILSQLPFESGRWVVAGSAPMLITGLVDTIADIDVVVDGTAWRQVVALSADEPRAGMLGDHIVTLEVGDVPIEVFDGWLGIGAVDVIAEAVEVEGYPFFPLERVLDSKRRLSRTKDLAHIELLEALLADGPGANGQ